MLTAKPRKDKRFIPKQLRFRVLTRDGFICRYCGRKPPEVTLEVDHVVPYARGGQNTLENLATCCRECNSGKRDVLLDNEFDVTGDPPKRERAAWEAFTDAEEEERLEILRARQWRCQLRSKEYTQEITVIMNRAIRRMRRSAGKT
jgi:hypothetical protein